VATDSLTEVPASPEPEALAASSRPPGHRSSGIVPPIRPKGLIWGIVTLIATGVLITFLNMGIGAGAAHFGAETEEPLLEGFKLTIGVESAKVLGLVAVAGLIASFHAIIYAHNRRGPRRRARVRGRRPGPG
jgi:hypothetical protein